VEVSCTDVLRSLSILPVATALSDPVLAETDPSLSQVYEAARIGQLNVAQQLMSAGTDNDWT
jgi:hypothetical protein